MQHLAGLAGLVGLVGLAGLLGDVVIGICSCNIYNMQILCSEMPTSKYLPGQLDNIMPPHAREAARRHKAERKKLAAAASIAASKPPVFKLGL